MLMQFPDSQIDAWIWTMTGTYPLGGVILDKSAVFTAGIASMTMTPAVGTTRCVTAVNVPALGKVTAVLLNNGGNPLDVGTPIAGLSYNCIAIGPK